MTVRIRTITFDCADPYLLVGFWSQLTGYHEEPDNPNFPDDPEGLLVAPDGSASLLFIKVPENKAVKNRVHLDLAPPPAPADAPVAVTADARDAEMQRALGLGATLVADHRREDRTGFVVLADPEGNEFCIERGISGG
jgi:catechol 2,3-dioxygenase-like lactoylglutathione lyase family enzyme